MGKVKNRQFWESATMNNYTFRQYYNRLVEISLGMFEWTGFPDTVDTRYLELALFSEGKAVFFYDEVLGYLTLRCTIGGKLTVYRIPMQRRAISENGYNKDLTDKDSVIIYNNLLRTNSQLDVEMFSKRLYNLDRAIDVNVNAVKTPIMIQCSEAQRLTMKNLYMKYEGNEPYVIAANNLNPEGIKVLQTGAPFIAPQMYELRMNVWNEALTAIGVANIDQKKERRTNEEVDKTQGAVVANRFGRLEARRQACEQINRMFPNLTISCRYREVDTSIGG